LAARLRGLGPVVDARTRVVVLGSFPGVASLDAGAYYAHPRNQFWTILERILGAPLAGRPYDERLQVLLDHRIGLWDVYASCVRSGSLDSAIEQPQRNDLVRLRRGAPALRAVGFNGRTAARFEPEVSAWGVHTAVLPSTSPAYAALDLDAKLAAWDAFVRAGTSHESGKGG